MHKIVVITASVRTGRKSDRVASFFMNYIKENNIAEAELVDLSGYNFPVFQERLKFQSNPSAELVSFANKIKMANGVLVVTPEYNGGCPASLKNVIDVLVEEWKHKPVAISTVSAGPFGGNNMIPSLQFSFWKLGALTVPALFPVANVDKSYDESGNPVDKAGSEKRAAAFLKELSWMMDAVERMK
ncbi:MAG: NADPH-dependent oxidoreductase [Chitinophagaceae bacterium]|nr:MAG: NADPH-dependent oxidoreductase [Chitinophagaceae bacterium]